MAYQFNFKQKSLKRRFLLILGFVTFLACLILGLMFMFYDAIIQKLDMSKTERLAIGALFVAYSVLRFSRLFKKEAEDEA